MSAIEDFINNPASVIDTTSVTAQSFAAAELLVWFLFPLVLCWNYLETWINEGHRGKFYNPALLKRALVISILLVPASLVIAELIPRIGIIMANHFKIEDSVKAERIKEILTTVHPDHKVSFKIWKFTYEKMTILANYMLLYFTTSMLFVVRFVMSFFIGFFVKYLVVVAPLAAAFSILPFLKDQYISLIKILMNASFAICTITILDSIFFSTVITNISNLVGDTQIEAAGNNLHNVILILSLFFTMVIFYSISIWLTSKYVGNPAASAVLAAAATVGAGAMKISSKVLSKSDIFSSKSKGGMGSNLVGKTTRDIADSIKGSNKKDS